MLLRTEAFRSAGETDTVVGFLSGSEVYLSGAANFTISSGSFTPHASCEEVVLAIAARTSGGGDIITGFTVTINSVAPDQEFDLSASTVSARIAVWVGHWRGAPSGTVAITADPGDGGSQWSAMIAYGMSLDRACIFGATAERNDDGATVATTGDQTITSEQADSLAVFAVGINNDPGAIAPDATDIYDERYEGETTAAGTGDVAMTVGTKALGAIGSKTLEADWVNNRNWASKLVELRAA